MTDEDDELRAVLAKDIDSILAYFEKHLDDKFELHGMTVVMLVFKAKVTLLSELHTATRQAFDADQKAKKLIDNLMRNTK